MAQFVEFRAQTMPQRALGPQFRKQLLGLRKNLIAVVCAAEQASPRTRYLLFSKQSDTSYLF
jgi:hypothetical protein